jgi:tripartite-type tricarboxylate transporter receptor subunit TctC
MHLSKLTSCFVAATLTAIASAAALAHSDYPDRTVKIIVPVPPGPIADALPRMITKKLSEKWTQSVIVENKPGAASNLGAEFVAKATPDGYTLLATPPGPLVISQSFFPNLGFDPAAFVPISIFAEAPLLLVGNPRVPAATLSELIAYAKANPGKLNFASPGIGSSPHLTGEMLERDAGIKFIHVPYKGLGPAARDLLGGQVDIAFNNLGNSLPLIRAGKLKVFAVASPKRIAQLPDVPAIGELYSGFYSTSWFAFVAPPHTPANIANGISQAIAEVVRTPDVVSWYKKISMTPVSMSPADTASFLKKEAARWHEVIAANGLAPK